MTRLAVCARLTATARVRETEWMPPEWVPHQACVTAWCAAGTHYGRAALGRIRAAQARIAEAIATFEPVVILVNGDDIADTRDAAARAVFAKLEPRRRIEQIEIDAIAEGGGIHCVTMQTPAR